VGVGPGVIAIPLRRLGRQKGRGGTRLGTVNGWTVISIEDAHLDRYYWSMERAGSYPRRRLKDGRSQRLSREIMGLQPGDPLVVDHINRHVLDNRRENLRVCTQRQNTQNVSPRKNTSSRFKGVSYRKDTGKWFAYGTLNYKMTGLGEYATEEEAGAVARAWRQEHLPYAVD
jgi:hypothetical protein